MCIYMIYTYIYVYMCIYIYVYIYMYTYMPIHIYVSTHASIYIYKRIYIYTRNYALAIASASFPPGLHRNALGITLGSRMSKPKAMILDPKIVFLNKV